MPARPGGDHPSEPGAAGRSPHPAAPDAARPRCENVARRATFSQHRRTQRPMATATAILDGLRSQLDTAEFKKLHWEGSFSEYLDLALESPGVTRTAYQRLYDMILSHGTDDVYENK